MDAAGTLFLYRSSPEAHGLLEPVSVLLKAQQTTTLILSTDSLKLPTTPLNYPGSLRMHIDAHLEEGGRETSLAPTLFFHPVESGWLFYDGATLESRFHNGLLTEAAQRLAAEGAQAAPPDPQFSPPIDGEDDDVPPTSFHTSSPSEQVSDSPYAVPGVDF